jgi:hypothetical protein
MPQRINTNNLKFDDYESTIDGFLRNHQPNEMHIKNLGEFKVYMDDERDENSTREDKFLISTNNIPSNYIHYVDTLVTNFAAEPNDIRYLPPLSNPAGMRIFVFKKITALKEFIKKLVELGDNLDNDVTIHGVPTDGGRRKRYRKSRKSRKNRKGKKSRRRH